MNISQITTGLIATVPCSQNLLQELMFQINSACALLQPTAGVNLFEIPKDMPQIQYVQLKSVKRDNKHFASVDPNLFRADLPQLAEKSFTCRRNSAARRNINTAVFCTHTFLRPELFWAETAHFVACHMNTAVRCFICPCASRKFIFSVSALRLNISSFFFFF